MIVAVKSVSAKPSSITVIQNNKSVVFIGIPKGEKWCNLFIGQDCLFMKKMLKFVIVFFG